MSKKTAKGPSKSQEPASFRLRTARDLLRKDVITAHGPRTFLKPTEEDSCALPEEYRNWLLVTLCDNEQVHRYCWAAIRPPRKVQWEIDAQARSDGFFAPHNYVPAVPEPAKFYQRKTGDAWAQGKPLEDAFGPRLNFLVRLSDCLEQEAMPGVQEWLLFSIATDSNAQSTEVVVTQRQAVLPVKEYSLTTTLGELVSQARSSATNTTVIERIEVQLGPPEDPLLTLEEQNLLGGVIMQIYEERLMEKGENLTVQEIRDQSANVREGVYNFVNSFTIQELIEKSRFAHLLDEEPAPMP
eukprot:s5569_g1.t1